MPGYIIGKVGVVKEVRGTFKSLKDHRDERPPIYSVMFNLGDISSRGSGNEKILVDVFEDWMMPE